MTTSFFVPVTQPRTFVSSSSKLFDSAKEMDIDALVKDAADASSSDSEDVSKSSSESSIKMNVNVNGIGKTDVNTATSSVVVDDDDSSSSTTMNTVDLDNESRTSSELIEEEEEDDEQHQLDVKMMRLAMELAMKPDSGSPFPKAIGGAVICTPDGKILGKGRSDYQQDAVLAAISDAGLRVVPLSDWVVSWPESQQLRHDLQTATLYVTMEPSNERRGSLEPSMTQLIATCGLSRVVIGCADPVPERSTEGAAALHKAGVEVVLGDPEYQQDCEALIEEYTNLSNTKLQRWARRNFRRTGRPLGFLHCSVVDSDNVEAFARQGNAFGKDFGGQNLSFRDFGSYELAPPPDVVWAGEDEIDFETEIDNVFSADFEEEEEVQSISKNPMMPWYEQVDAVVVTFPKKGNGPADDETIMGRLNGVKWLATIGESLPANVERIVVMDATDLAELPIHNENINVPLGVDIEAFWAGKNRKPTRVLLRKGENAQAQAAARAAAQAAEAAALAAQAALEAMESGEAAEAAESAVKSQQAASVASAFVQQELAKAQDLKSQLVKRGVVLETLNGGDPIDVMNHLGKRNGYTSVVWRAGCWGERGVQSILAGAFQYVSAHLAVDAAGGRFWQLMLAERAVQAACGPERKVKVFADQEDISLEYCDEADADKDCVLNVAGRPVRHVRLDCRVALVDETREREFVALKTTPMTKKKLVQDAPWFL